MTAIVLRGDARALPLPDASVDLIVTSPPYWSLRDYRDGDESLAGQIGNEPTPVEYLKALWECTREWMRVLKPSGSLWINLGDKYSQRVATRRSSHQDGLFPGRPDLIKDWKRDRSAGLARMPYENITNAETGHYVPEKSLIGLPWRYAIGCIDDLGLILRAEVIWDKPNGLPESVTDRVRRSHEHWFHFTARPRYYSAVDEIRTPRSDYRRKPGTRRSTPPGQRRRAMADTANPLGALPCSVWQVPTEPLRVPEHLGADHYAAFPTAWPRRIITGWSPSGICTACGEGRRPAVHEQPDSRTPYRTMGVGSRPQHAGRVAKVLREDGRGGDLARKERTFVGYACACPAPDAPTRPAVVLDPFSGTGTVALVAKALGRIGIGVDRSADYCRIALWRTNDPDQLAKAAGMPKPQRPVEGQEVLDLGELTA